MATRTTFEVQVWGVRRYKGKRKTTYTVRWKVEGRIFQETFDTIKLAESFRARLLVGLRQAEPFDVQTGQPVNVIEKPTELCWLDHAMAFVDVKWPHASPRHRKGIAEGLTTATVAALPAAGRDSTATRRALENWVFNSAARSGAKDSEPPEEHADAVRWARRRSPSLVEMAEPARLRRVLDALALKLDGKPASSSTVARKRSALYSAFQYAVEVDALPANPMDRIAWKPPKHTDEVDRRVVVNPHQAKRLLAEVAAIYPSLEAFFACIYYAGLRPSEVRHLKVADLNLPTSPDAWGTLHLLGSTQTAGAAWTDTGRATGRYR